MSFQSHGNDYWNGRSPGGFEFGVTGWVWGQPIPKSITFYLDGSAMVCDQYGRQIRRVVQSDGTDLHFADTPPEASKEGIYPPRPQFASHAQVIAALVGEQINWLAYEVRYRAKDGSYKVNSKLTADDAMKLQNKLVKEGNSEVIMSRMIVCSGWPQLPYDELKKMPELPPTPIEELRKIADPQLRKDALKIRREVDSARQKEYQAVEEE